MDAVLLSRLQFAVTVFFHFIFVPLTIGLGLLVALFETQYLRTKDAKWKKIACFWGTLFKINFAFGVVTGFAMTFQFGTNWSEYAEYMGDIFASPLALEALLAFFMESTFFGIWISVSHKRALLKTVSMWLVCIGTTISSLWIIAANAFMQHPVGYELAADGSKVLMSDFFAVLGNPYLWYMLIHTILAAYLLTGAFVIAVSGYHLMKGRDENVFRTSFKAAAVLFIIAALLIPALGMTYGHYVAAVQPLKAAAMEAVWEGGSGIPMYLFSVPGSDGNIIELIGIPKVGSFLLTGSFDGTVSGLHDFDQIPPVAPTYFSFRGMIMLGMLFIAESLVGLYLSRREDAGQTKLSRAYFRFMMWTIPLPYIAIALGWAVAEIGRQPWIVYGLLKTSDAVSATVPSAQILFTLVLLTVFYLILGVLDICLMRRAAVQGPEECD